MKKILLGLAMLCLAGVTQAQAQNTDPMATGIYCLNTGGTAWVPAGGATGACIGASTSGSVASIGTQYPTSSTPITASATGTTAATTATLAGVSAKTTYICGFSIRANATAAVTGTATVTGTITGTMSFVQWTAPLASGIGLAEETFSPCVPASAVNTGIAVISAAPGTGGTVSVVAWGYQV